jgi:hypothetical protein
MIKPLSSYPTPFSQKKPMRRFAAIRLGAAHQTYCEDYLISEQLGEKCLLSAVLDGCSMGKDSHFASALFGKLLRKIAQQMSMESMHATVGWEEDQPETVAREVLRRLFDEVQAARKQLMLEREELLTTVILWLHHLGTQRSFVMVIGDGYVCCDGQIHELDQNNRPDYLTYHLGESFDEWYETQQQRFHFESPQDLSIATDGVDTFRRLGEVVSTSPAPDPLRYLLTGQEFFSADNMLDRKLDLLTKSHGLRPIDDLGIIRAIF